MPQSQKVLERRKKHQLGGFEKTLTVQADKQRCCVNNIMAKFRKTGLIDHIREHEGRYANVADVQSFQDAMNIVVQAEQSFDQLPAEIRKKFDNDPAQFLDFVKKPENEDELVKMGLARKRSQPEDEPAPVTKKPKETEEKPSEGGVAQLPT